MEQRNPNSRHSGVFCYLPFPGVGFGVVASYDPVIVHVIVEGCFSTNQPFGENMDMSRENSGDIVLKFTKSPTALTNIVNCVCILI